MSGEVSTLKPAAAERVLQQILADRGLLPSVDTMSILWVWKLG